MCNVIRTLDNKTIYYTHDKESFDEMLREIDLGGVCYE